MSNCILTKSTNFCGLDYDNLIATSVTYPYTASENCFFTYYGSGRIIMQYWNNNKWNDWFDNDGHQDGCIPLKKGQKINCRYGGPSVRIFGVKY